MKYLSLFLFAMSMIHMSCKEQKEIQAEDPYLWLEDIEGERSLEWIKAHNEVSENKLTSEPVYEHLKTKYLEAFNDKEKIISPEMVGDYVYNLWKDEVNERGLWRRMFRADFIEGKTEWEKVLDLDELSEKEGKKWVYKGAEWLPPDYNKCLLSISDGGKDETEIREFDAVSKTFVKGGFFVEESKGGASWIDENHILVGMDFGPGTMTTSGYPRLIKQWKRGQDNSDAVIVAEKDSLVAGLWPYSYFYNGITYPFARTWVSAFETEWQFIGENGLNKIDIPSDAEVGVIFRHYFILTLQSDWSVNDQTFKAGSVVSYDFTAYLNGQDPEVTLMYQPDAKSSVNSLVGTKDFIVLNVMDNVVEKLVKFTPSANEWKIDDLQSPDNGSIMLRTSSPRSNDFFFIYSSLIEPYTLFVGNDNTITEVQKVKANFETGSLVLEQYEASSRDGTKVPYFIVHKEDFELNGQNPTLIDAYGGFNVSQRSIYDMRAGIGWIEQGGIYVVANIRGGGEFGPSWHQAAMKEKRQNAYDDFYAVAEDLIQREITSPDKLGIFGWSNGGLLTGVAFTQRPDLYAAVVVGAPLLDMKRYNKMLAGASWMGEYGNPDLPEDWAYIQKYSPFHNLSPDKSYPEVFFITSIKDDRVHPGHARKMAAKMEEMSHPFLYYETIEGGHGAASTNEQQATMWAMVYSYLNMKLMMN